MPASIRPATRRAAIIAGAAGLAVIGTIGAGAAAFADGAPSPAASTSASSTAAPGPHGGPDRDAGPHHAPHIGGRVLTVDGRTVTVQDRDGFTRTIVLASGASITKDGAASSVAAIAKDTWIEATGTVDRNGTTLDATTVTIGRPTPPKGGPAGPRGAGPGARAGQKDAPATPSTGATSAPARS